MPVLSGLTRTLTLASTTRFTGTSTFIYPSSQVFLDAETRQAMNRPAGSGRRILSGSLKEVKAAQPVALCVRLAGLQDAR